MARIALPSPDVKLLNPDGTVSQGWYDFLRSLSVLKLTELADVSKSAPTNGDTVRFSTTDKNWSFGA